MAQEPQHLKIAQIKGKDLRTVHPVDWPGLPDRKVGLMELRCSEQLEAYFAAREVFARKGWETIDPAAVPSFEEELHVQYCYRMLVDPETVSADPRFRICESVDETRQRLDANERNFFVLTHNLRQNAGSAGKQVVEQDKAQANALLSRALDFHDLLERSEAGFALIADIRKYLGME